MSENNQASNKAFRLRLGVLFILLWWIPIWLISPLISDALGYGNDPSASHKVLLALVIIQTIFGVLGVLIASREVATQVKHTPYKKVPLTMWRIIWTGETDREPTKVKAK